MKTCILYSYGPYSYDLHSYGSYSYGLHSYGLHSHGADLDVGLAVDETLHTIQLWPIYLWTI